jgi:hypothetical protein
LVHTLAPLLGVQFRVHLEIEIRKVVRVADVEQVFLMALQFPSLARCERELAELQRLRLSEVQGQELVFVCDQLVQQSNGSIDGFKGCGASNNDGHRAELALCDMLAKGAHLVYFGSSTLDVEVGVSQTHQRAQEAEIKENRD